MNFFRRLRASFLPEGWKRPLTHEERLWAAAAGGPVETDSGEWVSRESVLGLDAVQAVLEQIAGTLKSPPLHLLATEADGRTRRILDDPVLTLLNRQANPTLSAELFREEMLRHLALERQALAEIVRDADGVTPVELWPIHPDRLVRIERRGPKGELAYEISDGPGKPNRRLAADQVLHIRRAPLCRDGLSGEPVWKTSREVFGRALAVARYGARFFRNSGKSGGVLEHPGRFTSKEEQAEFLEAWRSAGVGPNAHKDRLLLQGVKYAPHDVKNNEAQFIETAEAAAMAVARLWNMPPHKIGLLARATHQNIESENTSFVTDALVPIDTAFCAQAGAQLLAPAQVAAGIVLQMDLFGLLRGDSKTMFEAFNQARQAGVYSADDIRQKLGENPIGGRAGRTYWRPANMADAAEEAATPSDPKRDETEESDTAPAPEPVE